MSSEPEPVSPDQMSREDALATFQAVTGIQDVEEAIRVLTECDWNLFLAVNKAGPVDTHKEAWKSSSEDSAFRVPYQDTHDSDANNVDQDDGSSAKPSLALTKPLDLDPNTTTSDSNSNELEFRSSEPAAEVTMSNKSETGTWEAADSPASPSPSNQGGGSDEGSVCDMDDFTDYYPDNEDDCLPPPSKMAATMSTHLIPDHVRDIEAGSVIFSENFTKRYGHCTPLFLHGDVESAIVEANVKPVAERRLLAIYLHHDDSILSNVFCQKILCSEPVVDYLVSNFVVWGWDCTLEPNRQLFLSSLLQSFPSTLTVAIRSFSKDKYPLLVIISRLGTTLDIDTILHSIVTRAELMTSLININEQYQSQKEIKVKEEEERVARQSVIQNQNVEFQASLKADKEKSANKLLAEVYKKNKELIKKREEKKLADEIERCKLALSKEPQQSEDICTLRVRVPGGAVFRRRFLKTNELSTLFVYLTSEGYDRERFRYFYSYPKEELCETHCDNQPIGEIFKSQDTVFVEEK